MTQTTKPLGATDVSPLVARTADIARFLRPRLEQGTTEQVVSQIKACKDHGQNVTTVSYDTLRRIVKEDNVAVADNAAEAILISQGASDLLGKDIPLYRNPFMSEKKFVSTMKQRLQENWDDEIDGDWNEREQLEYILAFPSITPP